jgi:flavin reductase (DIM6/NTAB) family NADH-FMN oxidoreductase RutF
LREQSRLGLSVLAEEQEAACRELASKTGERFANLRWHASDEGAVFILGAVGWFDCSLYSEVTAGDHTIALLEIRRAWAEHARAPLVFHGSRYRRLATAEQGDGVSQGFSWSWLMQQDWWDG